eukprot:scpid106407/ scgid15164/ 
MPAVCSPTSSPQRCPRSTGMAISAVLPSLAGDDCSASNVASGHGRSPPGSPIMPPPTVGSPPASRLDYLRQSASQQGLSPQAATLWVASWRTSTSASYQSAWKRWLGWCSSRHTDPLAVDAVSVANFLAQEFTTGKEYRTLNVYRSALSSTLPTTGDGTPLGQTSAVKR